MAKKGRKSAAELSVVRPDERIERPAPPPDLDREQRDVWQQTVNALPAEWIRPESTPLLAQYCRHACRARRVAAMLSTCEAEGFHLDDYRDLLKMEEQQTRAMSSLATRLRLTNQARQDPKTAARERARHHEGHRPWE